MACVVWCKDVSNFRSYHAHSRQGDPMNKWDYLDEEYEEYQSWEPIRKNGSAVGSLTDNVRFVEPNRNGAHKRVRKLQRELKEYTS